MKEVISAQLLTMQIRVEVGARIGGESLPLILVGCQVGAEIGQVRQIVPALRQMRSINERNRHCCSMRRPNDARADRKVVNQAEAKAPFARHVNAHTRSRYLVQRASVTDGLKTTVETEPRISR